MQNLSDEEMAERIIDVIDDPSDLCTFLEIEVRDLLEAFPNKVRENYHKFSLPESTEGILDDEEIEDTKEEGQAW